MPVPWRIINHVVAGGEIRAWNAQFERVIWRDIAQVRYGWPEALLEQFVCSAAEAAAMSLPRNLDGAARVLGAATQKDADGYSLMLRMTRPRKVNEDGTLVWWDVPDRLMRLYEYCKQDVRTERAIAPRLRRLGAREREVYLLDQKINDRGVAFDRRLVVAAKVVADEGVRRANVDLRQVTDGAVSGVTATQQLRAWLGTQGVETASVDKATTRDLLAGELPEAVRHALQLRADNGRSSVAKLDSMLSVGGADDRLRGLLLYHAAGTGRWAGRLVQPQNFPRGEVEDVEQFIPDVLAKDYDCIDLWHPPVVVVSSLLRAMLVASPGHDLIAADYSAIEARVLNWLAGQSDIVQLFAAGEDVYRHNAARLYGIPLEEVQKFPHRQTGKFQELACGFGMGAAKGVTAASTAYGLTISEAEMKDIVASYRDTHKAVVKYWHDANAAVIEAVRTPGVPVRIGPLRNVSAIRAGGYLYIVLPSMRPLCYASPSVVEGATPWGEVRPAVECWGVGPFVRQWAPMRLYGGLITENIVQAVARDLIAEGMLRAEYAGYPVVLSVHDEAVSEVPEGFGSVGDYERILCELPAWAEGCPVAAEGWRGKRYRK